MECERDLLVEASCPGFRAMLSTPCVGGTGAWPALDPATKAEGWGAFFAAEARYRQHSGLVDFSARLGKIGHPVFKKRIDKVMECRAYYGAWLWMIHAYKNNKTYAFIEVTQLLEEKPGHAPRLINLLLQGRAICFFLGSYPVYWSRKESQLQWVTSFPSPPDPLNFWAVGTTPFIPSVDMTIFTRRPEADWPIWTSAENIKIYKEQKKALFWQANWQKECLRKNYPPEVYKPKRIVQTPKGPGTYDLPMSELTPPTIDMPPQPLVIAPPRLYLTFSQIDQNTLGLRIDAPREYPED